MRASPVQLACCLCGKSIPDSSDVYALDEEWQRRFPAMTGVLACARCAVHDTYWSCEADGHYVDGHRPATSTVECIDSWSHIENSGTHIGMIQCYPWSGLLQGAEEYLRAVAHRPGADREVRQRLHDLLQQWDTQRVL